MVTIEKQISEQEKKRLTKLYEDNTTPEERTVYQKLKKILEHFSMNIFPDQFDAVKSELLYSKEYEQQLKQENMKYKSAKIYPLIASVHDTFMDSLYDNDLRPKVFPMEEIDPEKVDNAERFFQRGTEISETEQTLEIVRNECSLIGASYCIPGYTTDTMKSEDGKDKTIFIPSLYPVSFFEMFYSIGATDFYKAPEKFRRRFIPFSQLEETFYPIREDNGDIKGMGKTLEEKRTAILEYPMPLSKADYTKIYDINAYSSTYLGYIGQLKDGEPISMAYDNTFNVLDDSSYCEVIDLYIGDQLMILVNGYFVYSGLSPFYYGKDNPSSKDGPFIEMVFEKKKGTMPVGIAHKLKGHQKQCNALFNSISDAVYRHLNPMLSVINGAIIDPVTGNTPTSIYYQEGKTYAVNPSYAGINNAIFKIDFTDYNILQLAVSQFENIKADAYNIVGVNSYVLGGEGKVERSRYGAEQRVAGSKARLSPMVKSIGRLYSKLFYHWLGLAESSGANIAYIQNDDREDIINLDEIFHKFKIVCSADVSVEETKASKVQGLLTMQQNTQAFAQNPITGLPEIDNGAFLSSIADYAGLKGFKPISEEEQKEYIDKSYRIKDYVQQKEMELQAKTQQAQPTTEQGAQPTEQDVMSMLQGANPQQPSQGTEDLGFEFAQ